IVTTAAEQSQGTNLGPATQKMTEGGTAGTHHQLKAGNPHGFNGKTVQLPDLIGTIQPQRERDSHSGRRSGRSLRSTSSFHASLRWWNFPTGPFSRQPVGFSPTPQQLWQNRPLRRR